MSSPPPSVSAMLPMTLSSTNNNNNNIDSFTKLFLLTIFISLMVRVCYVFVSIRRDQQGNNNPNGNNTLIHLGDGDNQNFTGLPINVIKSYLTFPYSKTNVATIYDHETTCSICIEDYKDSEMLRMMPQCRHYFHRDCVDAWLKVNASCPVCRNSLVEASNNGVPFNNI